MTEIEAERDRARWKGRRYGKGIEEEEEEGWKGEMKEK